MTTCKKKINSVALRKEKNFSVLMEYVANFNLLLMVRGEETLEQLLPYKEGKSSSRLLTQTKAGQVKLFAFPERHCGKGKDTLSDIAFQILEGKACLFMNGKKKELQAGEIVVVPEGVEYQLFAKKRMKFLMITESIPAVAYAQQRKVAQKQNIGKKTEKTVTQKNTALLV